MDVGIKYTKNVINHYAITNLNDALNFSSEHGEYNPNLIQYFCERKYCSKFQCIQYKTFDRSISLNKIDQQEKCW